MTIGIPKEIKEREDRVSCTPGGVRMLTGQGHRVVVESGAGIGSGYPDADYEAAGAEILVDADKVFAEAEMILKVKEPLPDEFHRFRSGQILFTYLHLAANPSVAAMLQERGVIAFAYESVEVGRRLPLLEPMSEIAGRMSVMVGSWYLSRPQGGNGTMLGGVPGVLPGKVMILGGGTSGVNASRMALGLGADVTILDIDLEKMRFIDIALHSATHTLFSNEQNVMDLLPHVDLLVGAVLIPGARAPKLIKREMLKCMKPGAVFVDIAIDQGGCAETSRATSHKNPVFIEEDVIHYCVANMPGAYARTATQALTNATMPLVVKLANLGWEKGCDQMSELKSGLNVLNGKIVHPTVAAALNSVEVVAS